MDEQKDIVVCADKMNSSDPLSYEDIRQNTILIKNMLEKVMRRDVDYGVIPGCGNKPSLLKPGAEKIMLMFKLGCFLKVDDQSEPGIVKYVVRTTILHLPTNRELGIGVGMCSSDEEKYAWRKAVCKEEFESLPEDKKRLKWKPGWQGKPAYSIQQVRTNAADLGNTILKMAAKRSKIDGVITVTAASDILSQDADEIQTNGDAPPLQKPQPKKNGINKEEGRPMPAGFKEMASKYEGHCKGCNGQILIGDTIYYSKDSGTFHYKCLP